LNSEWSYPLLKKAPCRYRGSIFTDGLIIAGRNFQRHFGNLKLLNSGDWDLTLFTCTIGGVSRVTVRCQKAE
jgi:sortase A